jgi:hypothetical protein
VSDNVEKRFETYIYIYILRRTVSHEACLFICLYLLAKQAIHVPVSSRVVETARCPEAGEHIWTAARFVGRIRLL